MKLFVLVLNQTEKLGDLMREYAKEKICGATILESSGMARSLLGSQEEDISFLNSIRKYLRHGENEKTKTIFAVIRKDQEDTILNATKRVIDFSQPDTGIMFVLNLEYAFGKGLEN